jgi:hypothetical protein
MGSARSISSLCAPQGLGPFVPFLFYRWFHARKKSGVNGARSLGGVWKFFLNASIGRTFDAAIRGQRKLLKSGSPSGASST